MANGKTHVIYDPRTGLRVPTIQVDDLQRFIAQEKHLPNVPAAAEIKEKGLNLGEFQMRLLEKVEELTLYAVQQAKAIDKKDVEITTLKSSLQTTVESKDAEIANLNSRLTALEQMMDRLTKNGSREQK